MKKIGGSLAMLAIRAAACICCGNTERVERLDSLRGSHDCVRGELQLLVIGEFSIFR